MNAPFLPASTLPTMPRLRAVDRAIADLRRGTPVLLTGVMPLIVLAAETASPEGLADVRAMTDGPAMLLLSPERAAALLDRAVPDIAVVAWRMPDDLLRPDSLLAAADPTIGGPRSPGELETMEAPALAAEALLLGKLGRLLPAMLAAPASPDARLLAAARGLLSVDAAEVLAYPAEAMAGVRLVADARVPLSDAAQARVVAFRPPDGGMEQLAIVVGAPDPASDPAPLVRIHSECFTGDLLGSLRCDCGEQLRHAIARMEAEGAGVLLYLAQEGRGIGLVNKLRAYALQDRGLDTLDANRALGWGADERSFGVAATMLKALGLTRVRLLTNNPDKIASLIKLGIAVTGRVSHVVAPNGTNDRYLATKAKRFGHLPP